MELEDLTTAPPFAQKRALAFVAAANAQQRRRDHLRDLVIGERQGQRLGEIVTLVRAENPDDPDSIENDAYAVEVRAEFLDGRCTRTDAWWMTVVNGGTTRHVSFEGPTGRWMAILHAIAQVHDTDDDRALGAFYAGRVLGLPEAS